MKSFLIILLFINLAFEIHPQQKLEPYTVKAQLDLDIPSDPVISPDGKNVVFTIRSADYKNNKWNTQVYLLDIKTKKYKKISPVFESCSKPSFSPDQKWITYFSNSRISKKDTTAGNQQLWGIDIINKKNPVKLTNLNEDIEEYAWSNSSNIVALLSIPVDSPKTKMERMVGAEVYPRKNPDKLLHIFDVKKKKIISSFKLDPGAENISFAGSDNILYQTNYSGEVNDEQKYDIYKLDLKGNKIQLTSEEGPETSPASSPDGKYIAFITQTVPDIEFAETDLKIMDNDGKNRVNLTKDFNLSVNKFIWKNFDNIFFTVSEGTNEELYQIDIKTGKIEKMTEGNKIVSDLSSSSQTKDLCCRIETNNTLPEIHVNGKLMTDFSKQLSLYNPGGQNLISYKSRDNKFNIEGILFKPKDFDSTKKYPLILTVHGGPYGRFKNSFLQYDGIKIFTDNGYVVFAPNPRGSSGYSDEFGQANRYDIGGNDYEDIMAGIDYIISKGFVDTTRMGVIGGSYGGYLTNWIISQNNKFKAAVSMYGIFSLITDWSNSQQPGWEEMYLGYNYWDNPVNNQNLYIKRSPSFYIKNIKTPTLLLHGEKDIYTDVANSREMYQGLHSMGIPVELVIYPRANHGIGDEPDQFMDVVNRSLEWFEKYIPSVKIVKRNYE